MPVVAADLDEAMSLTTDRIALENRTLGQVQDQFVLFTDAVALIFDAESVNGRTVRNWLVQASIVQINITPGPGEPPDQIIGPFQRQQVVDVVERILSASVTNTNQITNAQRTELLDAWNDSFGALP